MFACPCGFQGLSQRALSLHRTKTHGYPLSTEALIQLYLQGVSQEQIRRQYHIDLGGIRKRLASSGILIRNQAEGKWWPRLLEKGWQIATISHRPEPPLSRGTAYLLGALDGDGCIYRCERNQSSRLQFAVTSIAFHGKLVKAMEDLGITPQTFIVEPKREKWSKVYGCFGTCKAFADWYQSIPGQRGNLLMQDLYWDYMCGFHEAEGSVLNNNGCPAIEIWNTDHERLTDCKAMLEALGFHPTLRPVRRRYKPNESQGFKLGLYRGPEVLQFLTVTATWKTGPWKEVMRRATHA